MSEESFFDYSQAIVKLPPIYSFTTYTPSFGSESIDKEEWFFPDQASVQRKNQFATAVKDGAQYESEKRVAQAIIDGIRGAA